MRRIAIAAVLAGCGRIGFDPLANVGDDASGDAAPAVGFSKLVAYADQTCALHTGQLYCWGRNDAGQLGDETTMNRAVPTAVHVPAGIVKSAAQGEAHACAIVDATLYCWGKAFTMLPTAVAFPATVNFVDAGRDFTCAGADKLYCWGTNSEGQVGDGSTMSRDVPTPVALAANVVAVDAGDDHACGLADTGEVFCWGHNDNGALGTGSFNPPAEPMPVPTIATITTLPLIAGWHACTVEGGAVGCWGRNTEGELGNGQTQDSATPVSVGISGITALATGGGPTDHDASCAAAGAELLCWGAGKFGRLGNGSATDQPSPVQVVGLPNVAVTELAIGYDHACARLVDGDIWCWGRGDAGQLGNGAFEDRLAPVRVMPP
jgi:alpha-tubulin suppressor-like RCC1 family protein